MKLNQWQRELLKLEKQADKDLNRKLYNAYNDSLKEVRARLKAYMDEYEDLPYYKQQQAGKLSALEKEIVELLNGAYPKAKHEVTEFKRNELMDGYYSSMYQIESETGARLDFIGLDKEFVRQSVANPIAGKTLSKRLYSSRVKLANRASSELTTGMIQGKSYAEIAKAIKGHTEANYAQALRIARTEGGRLRSLAKQEAYQEAKDMGIDLQKRWYSSLDRRTRSSHQQLDGQTVEIDENFVSPLSGAKGPGPRLLGRASEDINCRCTTITIVDGIEPDSRYAKNDVGHSYEKIKYKSYTDWKSKRVNEVEPVAKFAMFNAGLKSQLNQDQLEFYEEQFLNGNQSGRNLWNKHQDKLVLADSKYVKGDHFAPRIGVNMNIPEDIKGSYYSPPGNTFYHEFGHHLDFVAGEGDKFISQTVLSNGKTLGETIFNEVRKHIQSTTGEHKSDRVMALRALLKIDYDKNIAAMSSLSDLFGGATANNINLGVGHKTSYWKPPKYIRTKPAQYRNERLGKEGFAEMFAATFTDSGELEMFDKWLPESYNMFEELLKVASESGD